ncbi:MAG: ABC transporter ATP-binding protein [Clostridia bacterium]
MPMNNASKNSAMRGKKLKNSKKTIRRLLTYFGAYKWLFSIVVVCILVSAIGNILGTSYIKPLLDDYIVPIIGAENPDMSGFVYQLVMMGIVYIISSIAGYGYNRLMINVSNGILLNIRKDMFYRMQDLPIKYFDERTHGEIMSRYTNDTDAMREMISQAVPQLVNSTIRVVGVFAMMFVLSPALTGLTLIMLFVMVFFVTKLGKKSGFYFKQRQQSLASVNGYIEEMIEGQKVVKVFCHEDTVGSNFDVINEKLRLAASNANSWANALMPVMSNLSYIHYAFTAMAGALLVALNGTFAITLGTLATFLQYSRNFAQPITQLSQQFTAIMSALAGAERVFDLIDSEPEDDEGKVTLVNVNKNNKTLTLADKHTGHWAWKRENPDGSIQLTELLGDVEFLDVTFSYDGEKNVLNDISLYAKPGQKIAFVGSTGAGKTTITNLINRFYDIDKGIITYDGINIKDIKKADLRRSLSMVLQDTHLFTGTVMENIRYGNLDATDEEIHKAARLSNADYFISHLPDGYNTIITGDGSNLSQGQRQLLAIARAAVADPPVLILDEATSSIDTRTEALIEKGMDRLMKGRTVFVIAHRLSTVLNSDAIMVLEQGNIIERGNHDSLLAERGKYYNLYTGLFELS